MGCVRLWGRRTDSIAKECQTSRKTTLLAEPLADLFFTPDSTRLNIITVSGQLVYWDCLAGKELPPGADFKPPQGTEPALSCRLQFCQATSDLWDRSAGRRSQLVG